MKQTNFFTSAISFFKTNVFEFCYITIKLLFTRFLDLTFLIPRFTLQRSLDRLQKFYNFIQRKYLFNFLPKKTIDTK